MIEKYAALKANYELAKHGASVFLNDIQILKATNNRQSYFDKFNYIKPSVIFGSWISHLNNKIIKLTTIEELRKLGFILTSHKVIDPWSFNQRVEYKISKRVLNSYPLNEMPKGHFVIYNLTKGLVQLCGQRAGTTGWGRPISLKGNIVSNVQKGKIVEINEISFLITDDNQVVCIPKSNDSHIIGIAGKRRKGKSFVMHRICNEMYHAWNENCFIVNDIQMETGYWSDVWKKDTIFKSWLSKLNQKTTPFPTVYLQPIHRDVTSVLKGSSTGHLVSLEWKDILLNWENFYQGSENKSFGKTGEYIQELIYDDEGNIKTDGLFHIDSLKEAFAVIDSAEWGRAGASMKRKAKVLIKNIFNTFTLDINSNVPSKWKCKYNDGKEFEEYPWNLLMINKVVPVFQSKHLRDTPYHYIWMRKMLETIFSREKNPFFFKNKVRLNLFIDEIEPLIKNSITSTMINTMIKESGPANIGVCYVALNYHELPDNIRQQTTYLIVYNQIERPASQIIKDFQLDKSWVRKITNLKKFECVAIGDEDFVVYDLNNNRIYKSRGPFKGRIIPPTSRHSKPDDERPDLVPVEEYINNIKNEGKEEETN